MPSSIVTLPENLLYNFQVKITWMEEQKQKLNQAAMKIIWSEIQIWWRKSVKGKEYGQGELSFHPRIEINLTFKAWKYFSEIIIIDFSKMTKQVLL